MPILPTIRCSPSIVQICCTCPQPTVNIAQVKPSRWVKPSVHPVFFEEFLHLDRGVFHTSLYRRCLCNTAEVLTRQKKVPGVPGVHVHVSVFIAICCSRVCLFVGVGAMGRGVSWSPADIAELERLAAEGLAATAIYKLKRGIWPRSSIMKKLIQIKKTGTAQNKYRGRAEKLRQGDLDFADAEMELHPRRSVAELAAAIRMERGVACGRTTVWRAMRLKLDRHAY